MGGTIVQPGNARHPLRRREPRQPRGRARPAVLRVPGRARRRLRLRGAGGRGGRGRHRRVARRAEYRRVATAPRSSRSTIRAARWATWRAPCAASSAACVVGVTGSNGKTTTKELCAAALRPLGPVCRTAGSFNTDIGLPLTILSATGNEAAWVLEMAMRGRGEIAYLAEIARPAHRRHHQRRRGAPRTPGLARARSRAPRASCSPASMADGWAVLARDRSADHGAGRARAPPIGA